MPRLALATLIFALSCAVPETRAAQRRPEDDWDNARTLHFQIRRQSRLMDKSLHAKLEKVYGRLHTELFGLAPWMATEKANVYVYRSRNHYLAGSFRPPAWSGGLAAVPHDPNAPASLVLFRPVRTRTIGHELTHLYFHTFFNKAKSSPPRWLDEGLASMLEDEILRKPNPRYRGPRLKKTIPLEIFFDSAPQTDSPANRVRLWYSQAHSLVRFLKRSKGRFKFESFCRGLRDGMDEKEAFKRIYGFRDWETLEKAWKKWAFREMGGNKRRSR